MVWFGYVWNELRRRWGRTLLTALGLAAGVGLVMGIIGVSEGLSDAQNRVLSPLGSVGTDIIVTRTVAATTTTGTSSTTTTTTPSGSGGGFRSSGGTGGRSGRGTGGFFAQGVAGAGTSVGTSSQAAALADNNSSVITDLAKLGKPGTKFTHDFFVAETLLTFPSVAVNDVSKISGVSSAVGALYLQVLHESGTVPKIAYTYKTGGQTISTSVKQPKLTAAQTAAERACVQQVLEKAYGGVTKTRTSVPSGGGGGSSGGRTNFGGFATNPAFEKCLTPAQINYDEKVVVPEQTITRILTEPTTNTATSSYSVAGVDATNETTGLVTKAQLVSGTWFTATSTNEVLVNAAYASAQRLKVNGTVTINSKSYKIVGLVSPTLTGNVADIYFSLSTMQHLASAPKYVNELLVSVKNSADVAGVTKAIKAELPGATVLTSKSLAKSVTGSLNDAHKLAQGLGTILAIIVLLAAFLIAGMLTLSSVTKRVREIGSLRAIGWTRGEVVRQIMAETIGIGVIGGLLGVGVGVGICALIAAIGPTLSVNVSGLAVGASSLSQSLGQSTTSSVASLVHLTAPVHFATMAIAFGGALVGGVVAGVIGGWRAARLEPASAMRDLG